MSELLLNTSPSKRQKINSLALIGFSLNLILLFVFIIFQPNFLCSLILIVWLNIVIYSLNNMGNRSMLFAFSIAFFFFLLGRELLEQFFSYEVEHFAQKVWDHTDILLLVSLITYGLSYIIFSQKGKRISVSQVFYASNKNYVNQIKRLSLLLFWITLSGALIYAIILAIYVQTVGYIESYQADNNQFFRESFTMRMLNRCEMMLPVALCSFLATLPSKRECNKIVLCYCMYLFITLFGGARGECILGLLLLFVYYFYRNKYNINEIWIKKWWIITGCISFPFLLIGLSALNDIRKGEKISFDNAMDGVINFVYQQGVSVNVIKHTYEHTDKLESDSFYSLSFLHNGIFSLFDDKEIPSGNCVERAQAKYWLAHTLPFIIWRKWYLAGTGTGSSYIAELDQDFGIIGVILGNIIYGYLLAHISFFSRERVFFSTIKLIIITKLLWAPRGYFTEFISVFMQASTLMALCFIFFGAGILCRKRIGYIFSH